MFHISYSKMTLQFPWWHHREAACSGGSTRPHRPGTATHGGSVRLALTRKRRTTLRANTVGLGRSRLGPCPWQDFHDDKGMSRGPGPSERWLGLVPGPEEEPSRLWSPCFQCRRVAAFDCSSFVLKYCRNHQSRQSRQERKGVDSSSKSSVTAPELGFRPSWVCSRSKVALDEAGAEVWVRSVRKTDSEAKGAERGRQGFRRPRAGRLPQEGPAGRLRLRQPGPGLWNWEGLEATARQG